MIQLSFFLQLLCNGAMLYLFYEIVRRENKAALRWLHLILALTGLAWINLEFPGKLPGGEETELVYEVLRPGVMAALPLLAGLLLQRGRDPLYLFRRKILLRLALPLFGMALLTSSFLFFPVTGGGRGGSVSPSPLFLLLSYGTLLLALTRGEMLYLGNSLTRLLSLPLFRRSSNLEEVNVLLKLLAEGVNPPFRLQEGRLRFQDEEGNHQLTHLLFTPSLVEPRHIRAEALLPEPPLPAELMEYLYSSSVVPEQKIYESTLYGEAADRNERYLARFFGEGLLCFSRRLFRLLQAVERYSHADSPVIFCGEPGTGRAKLARAMHSYRGGGELVEISCLSLNLPSIVSEIDLFVRRQEQPPVGLLLRDVDYLEKDHYPVLMPLFARFSGTRHVYFTADTDLFHTESMPRSLFYSLKYNLLSTIPLRERPEDIFYQLFYYSRKFARQLGREAPHLGDGFLAEAFSYSWPANTLELERVVMKFLLEREGPVMESLGELLGENQNSGQSPSPLEESERRVILKYLAKNGFHKNKTSRELGITINTLNSKIEKYGIQFS